MNLKLNINSTQACQYRCAKQRGVVLFFALIALVVMSLAAVALIRSVDTNTIIAGNLGFKQSATVSADSGVETAITWVFGHQAILEADHLDEGYYATSTGDAKTSIEENAKMATGIGISDGKDSSGNTISYVVQRMCKNAGPSSPTHCLFGPPGEDPNSNADCDYGNPCLNAAPSDSLMYRVTVKVTGPKNTVSYTQAFVY